MSYELVSSEERRVFERYVPTKQAFSLDLVSLGIIKNISLGGIAIYCINDPAKVGENSVLDIFLGGASFSLLPHQYTSAGQRSTPGQAIKINHICFNELSVVQINSLWHHIRSFCLPASDRQLVDDRHSWHVSSERHVVFQQTNVLQVKLPVHVSHNNDKNSLYASPTVQ